LAFALATLPATPAAAAPDAKELSRARAKFQQATELEQAGQYGDAIALFREVGQVRMTAQVRYHIAFCEEKLGRLVTALGGYELAQSEASEVGPSFEKEVAARINDLRARIPKIVVKRGEGAEAAKIEVDGVEVGESSIGVEMPVNPGPHTVRAKAPGFEPFSTTVEVSEKEVKPVEVLLTPAEDEPAGGASAGAAGGEPGDGGVRVEPAPSKVPPLLILGIGAASLAASGVFFYLRESTLSDLDDACGADRDSCPPDQKETYDEAKTYNTLSMVTLGVGVVGVGVGVTWLLTQKSPEKKSGWSVTPSAPSSEAGVSLIGRF
jgi:hypothetical protein